jgi:hypothetical protein
MMIVERLFPVTCQEKRFTGSHIEIQWFQQARIQQFRQNTDLCDAKVTSAPVLSEVQDYTLLLNLQRGPVHETRTRQQPAATTLAGILPHKPAVRPVIVLAISYLQQPT